MSEPPSPIVGAGQTIIVGGTDTDVTVVGADEQAADDRVLVDVARWCRLAHGVLLAEGRRGELTVTFVDRDEIAVLNGEHLGESGPTDVLSFPLDDDASADPLQMGSTVPTLLGDVVVCPAVAAEQAAAHAGTLEDELALLVVHGVLHVLGHDHAKPAETATMRAAELTHLEAHHWGGPAPDGFRQQHHESAK
jgi:probable rRNA maturation factor